jgi:hypothetical protein
MLQAGKREMWERPGDKAIITPRACARAREKESVVALLLSKKSPLLKI